MSVSTRRDRRYDARISVTLLSVRGEVEVFTANVSYRGLFLLTEMDLPARQLLRVRLRLPHQVECIQTNIVVAYSRPGGAGASFYGLDGEARARWEEFVESVRDQQPAQARETLHEALGAGKRRASGGELVLAAASVAGFERMTNDLKHGALLVHGAGELHVDATVSLRVVHPVTQKVFVVPGVVDRHLSGSGTSVRTHMDPGTRARLSDFVRSAAEYGSVDIITFGSMSPSERPTRNMAHL